MAKSGERVEVQTPGGGVAYVAWYFAADGTPTPTDVGAAKVEIQELDAAGEVIKRTYGSLS